MKFNKLIEYVNIEEYSYYDNLYDNAPDDYSQLGTWGMSNWHYLINEGLISTYPKNHVIKELEKRNYIIDDKSKSNGEPEIYIISYNNYDDSDTINSIISVYGYFVSKVEKREDNTIFSIEPKFTSELNHDYIVGDFYHITLRKNLDNIKRIGLSPKESSTLFYHPSDRIYLIKTDIPELFLTNFKEQLLMNKIEYIKKKYPIKLYEKMKDDYKIENVIVLKVNVEGLKLFKDPMFIQTENIIPCFTHQNISPDRIDETDF